MTADKHSTLHDTCNALAEPVADATGTLFGYGTYATALEAGRLAPVAAYAIDKSGLDDKVADATGSFVENNWQHVCETTETVFDHLADGYHQVIDNYHHLADDINQAVAEVSNFWSGNGVEDNAPQPSIFEDPTPDDSESSASNSEPEDTSSSWWGSAPENTAEEESSSWTVSSPEPSSGIDWSTQSVPASEPNS